MEKSASSQAAGLMLLSTLLYSVDPLIIALMGAQGAPFLFTAALQAGQLGTYALLTVAAFPKLITDGRIIRATGGWIANGGHGALLLLMGALSGLDYVLYLYCAKLTDVTVAAALGEIWIIFAVPLAWTLARNRDRYRRPTTLSMLAVATACAGAALVLAGQSTGSGAIPASRLALGGTLGILSSLGLAAAMGLFRWSEELVARLPKEATKGMGNTGLELYATSMAIMITGVLSIAMNACIGMASGETISIAQATGAAALGALVYATGSILWRAANILTQDLSLNALTSFTPVLALGWMWSWQSVNLPGGQSLLAIPRPELAAAGAAAIAGANLALKWINGRRNTKPAPEPNGTSMTFARGHAMSSKRRTGGCRAGPE